MAKRSIKKLNSKPKNVSKLKGGLKAYWAKRNKTLAKKKKSSK